MRFSCDSKLAENEYIKTTNKPRIHTNSKAATQQTSNAQTNTNSGTGTPNAQTNTNSGTGTPNLQTPATQTEEEKLNDEIAKESNCPSTAPTYDFDTFDGLPDDAARLHWLRCALKTPGTVATLKAATESGFNTTLLHSAAEHGDLESVKLLLKIVKIDVNARDALKMTALILAVKNDHLVVIKYLVSAGADVNAKDNYGLTALIRATDDNNLDIVEYLAKPTASGGAGADVTLRDASNPPRTACDHASEPNKNAMLLAMRKCLP